MRKLKNDLTGQTFGRLYVIGIADDGQRKTSYICQCECGNIKKVRADGLTSGATKSCGCLHLQRLRENAEKAPMRIKCQQTGFKVGGTRLYHIWQGIKSRCYKKSNARYGDYGGRGISVCDEWKTDFISFYDWAINNGYNDNLTIDRIDNDGNYEPSNCRWTTNKVQGNNRRNNINITIGNSTRSLTEWCEIFDVDYKRTNARYKRNGFESIDRLFNDIT